MLKIVRKLTLTIFIQLQFIVEFIDPLCIVRYSNQQNMTLYSSRMNILQFRRITKDQQTVGWINGEAVWKSV